MGASMIKTSILVSMYNKNPKIIEILDKMMFPSLLKNGSKDREIIILDDRSPLADETKKLIEKYLSRLRNCFGKVVFSVNSKNLGFGGSYNRAMSLASGENFIITNDDVYLPEHSIDYFEKRLDSDKNIGLVGPITGWKAGTYQYCEIAPKISSYSKSEFQKIEDFSKEIRILMEQEPLKKTYFITGFCFATRNNIMKELNGFDERFGFGHIEDTDLIRRVSQKYDTVIDPSIYIHHGGIEGGSNSILQHKWKVIKYRIINTLKYLKKWGDIPGFIHLQINAILTYYGWNTVTNAVNKRRNNLINNPKK